MSRRGTAALLAPLALVASALAAVAPTAAGVVPVADASSPASAVPATFAGANDRIAYTKAWYVGGTPGPDDRTDVFSVRPNGEGNKRLTFSRDSGTPMWSPSGRRIAYERPGEVWLMRADGAGKRRLTDGELVGWTPAGGKVLVVRGLDYYSSTDPTWVLHTVATGEEEVLPIDLPLVAGLDGPYDDYDEWQFVAEAALSPDGEHLALVLMRRDYADDQYDYNFGSVFTVRLDGSELTRVGLYTYSFGALSWSPDSEELAFWDSEPRSYCFDSLRSIRLDHAESRVHIEKPCGEIDPAWSPDGRKIAFTASRSGRLQIANLDGSHIKTVLPKTLGYRYDPDWRRAP